MKKKRIELNEHTLMSNQEQAEIRGGERTRIRTKTSSGQKHKMVLIE